jgi:hypothetical protein
MPPEVSDMAAGEQGNGAKEGATKSSADVQRHTESVLSQPVLHFDDAE